MTIQEIYALPVDGYGWRQLPSGNYVKLGNDVILGNNVRLGNYVRLGNHVQLGNDVQLGNYVKLGNHVQLGNDVKLGNYVKLGDNVTDAIDLGYCEGYRKVLACVNGVAYIGAGCRWFTLKDAVEYWANRDDRPMTKLLVKYAQSLAELKHWKEIKHDKT
jgi:hypothetical protein